MNIRSSIPAKRKSERPQNERLILGLVRRHGELSKAEIARTTKLSAQSATVIVNRLVEEGLLKAGKSVRGKVGQPSTPYRLNPLGAASVGMKVGRRSAEIVTMAYDYSIIEHRAVRYDYPDFEHLRNKLTEIAHELIKALPQKQAQAIQGVGLAIPDALWSWESSIGAPKGAMDNWRKANLRDVLEEALGLDVLEMNDATAASLASLRLGAGKHVSSMVYLYVGTFVGGGITVGNQVFEGPTGNAGAIGSLPTRLSVDAIPGQLLDHASLHALEMAFHKRGLDVDLLYTGTLSHEAQEVFDTWKTRASDAIAFAALSGQAFLDPDAIVLDTSLSPKLRNALVDAANSALNAYDSRGLRVLGITPCEVGIHARSLGSALLPFQNE